MKHYVLSIILISGSFALRAQNDYPEPEFTNEVYYLQKDSVNTVIRLEKGSSKMESKAKFAGYGGSETAYAIDAERSGVRLRNRKSLSFVFSTGASVKSPSTARDSTMMANGFDPSMMSGAGSMTDPANMIALYKAETGKSKRKILIQKTPGAFGGKKMQSSDKYTFSVRKVREGYWELVIDKTLSRGEYIFTMVGMGMNNIDGATTLFAFAID
jgi:hypothetical protein